MGRASIIAASTLVLLSLAGCGDRTPPPKTAAVESLPPPAVDAPTPSVRRSPTKDIAIRVPYGANDEITTLVYSDLSPLDRPDVVRSLAAGLADVANVIAGIDRPCIDAIVGGAKELLVAGGQRGWVAVVRIPDHKLEAVCHPSAKTGGDAKIEGTTKSWLLADSGRACATTPGWLACGYPELVKQSLAAGGEPTVPVDLVDTQILSVDDRDSVQDTKLTINAFPDRLDTRIEVSFDGDEGARALHETLAHAADMAPLFVKTIKATPDQQKLIEGIGNRLVVSHRGPRASIRVDLNGTPTEQASDMGTFASVMGALVLTEAQQKRRQAVHADIRAITENLVKAWSTKDPKGPFAKHERLVSAPAVPKTVPKGERVTTTAEGWKGWEVLGWSQTAPTYYQYEMKAAKDGQSVDVVARGDLNGDGKTSTFVEHIKIDPTSKQLMVEAPLSITDPNE